MSNIRIKMYKALRGDAFLLQFDNNTNIMIDAGFANTYEYYLKQDLKELSGKGKELDLLVFTHIHDDHINGGKKLLMENGDANNPQIIKINNIWHNSYRHLKFDKEKVINIEKAELEILEQIKEVNGCINDESSSFIEDIGIMSGVTLASYIYGFNYNWNKSFNGKAVCIENKKTININGVKITILSPDKNKLKNLSELWLKELNSKKKDFSLSSESIFDDAFEEYIRNKKFFEDSKIEKVAEIYRKVEDWGNSDTKPDTTEVNGSSISFIMEYKSKRLLFLGDSHEDIIIEQLIKYKESGENLFFDVIKLSHHGSEKNNLKILDIISGTKYLISTNGAKYFHPDKSVVAKILMGNNEIEKELYFNYSFDFINILMNNDVVDKYNYKIFCNTTEIEVGGI